MQNMKNVFLYHTTNEYSYKQMQEKGYCGLDQKDYELMAMEILNFYNVSDKKVTDKVLNCLSNFDNFYSQHQLNERNKKYIEMLKNGCVSFFPKLEECKRIKNHGEMGGEHKGSGVKDTLKIIAKYKKIPHLQLPDKDFILKKYGGIGSKPVVLEFNIPINLLCDYSDDDYECGFEITSYEKVSLKYFIQVFEID
jgi:hypothetical protein